jgi:metal-responsive CopG/Arc/MetJ family transcriptional regulator
MKKKTFTRPVSVVLTEEIFNSIKEITDQGNIGISDYIRQAIQEKLTTEIRGEKGGTEQ